MSNNLNVCLVDEGAGEFHQANVSVCQSSDGLHHLEGEVWKLGSCLTCTCHYGQVLCAAPECPPTPCAESGIEREGDCCLTCVSRGGSDGNAITNSSNDSSKLNCFSDDSHQAYANGEMWKVRHFPFDQNEIFQSPPRPPLTHPLSE